MSYQNYNYYGVYDEDSRKFSYSIQDIHKNQKEKDKQRLRIYEKILSKCFKKIKELSLHEETFCFFQLPEYIPGSPLYNMTECVIFILNSLKDKGFNARYVDPFMIFIVWNLPKPELKRKEYNQNQNTPLQLLNQPSISIHSTTNLNNQTNQQNNFNRPNTINNYIQNPYQEQNQNQNSFQYKPIHNSQPSNNFFFKKS